MGFLRIRALLFGIYIGAPDFRKIPYESCIAYFTNNLQCKTKGGVGSRLSRQRERRSYWMPPAEATPSSSSTSRQDGVVLPMFFGDTGR